MYLDLRVFKQHVLNLGLLTLTTGTSLTRTSWANCGLLSSVSRYGSGEVSADSLCAVKAEFILKTDDDQYVDLYEALVLARRYSGTVQYLSNRFLLCPVQRGLEIQVRLDRQYFW